MLAKWSSGYRLGFLWDISNFLRLSMKPTKTNFDGAGFAEPQRHGRREEHERAMLAGEATDELEAGFGERRHSSWFDSHSGLMGECLSAECE